MNTISIIIISTLIGSIIFLSTQNILFLFSKEIEESALRRKIINFVENIKNIGKISSEYFYTEYFIGLSNLSVEKNILKISIENKEFSFFISEKILDTNIIDSFKYCIIKEKDIIKIFDCKNVPHNLNSICEIHECRINATDCMGPKKECIGDGFCNIFIGENCINSIDCRSEEYVCCPHDPTSDLIGVTKRKNLKEGEECYCNNQCSDGLECNNVDENFKNYKSGKACCPKNKKWNGTECVERKAKITIMFIPTNFLDIRKFEKMAQEHFKTFVNVFPIRNCPERVEAIYESDINCKFDMVCNCIDLIRIENCALKSGKRFNYVVGITDQDFCGRTLGFACMGYRTVFVEGYNLLVTAHELGHVFGLNDEYVDACRCGYGLVNEDSNCLRSDIGGSDAVPPYDSSYCGEKGTNCPKYYDITCFGNKNDKGGRDIMSFGNAPGPRLFARESWKWLSQLDVFKCS